MRVGIFYATNTGYTETVAQEIYQTLGPGLVDACENIEDLTLSDLQGYDVLILGIATWDAGDLPYDWANFYDVITDFDFTGTKVAFFGLGDQFGYGETFLDAMGHVYRAFLKQGAIGSYGFWPIDDYEFDNSLGQDGDEFLGLGLDNDNEEELTEERLIIWAELIKDEFQA